MTVSTFRGRTIYEAMARVKNRLGPEAMILSTRQTVTTDHKPVFEIEAGPPGTPLTKNIEKNHARKTDVGSSWSADGNGLNLEDLMAAFAQHTQGIMEQMIGHPQALKLYARMIKSGIQERNARRFLEESGIFDESATGDDPSFSRRTFDAIANAIPIAELHPGAGETRTVAALIGTTGVGKTTTIAKIAALLMLKERKRTGLISVDTYRIGAFEQLNAYAKILGIPCYQAFKKEDLTVALTRLAHCEVILIDTAGQSQYDLQRVTELRSLLQGNTSISCHLCLSVGTDSSEMHQTVLKFSSLEIDSLIFTKLDEAERCGAMVNQVIRTPFPVSYLTTGQNVPDDIEKADRENIVRLLFAKN